RHLALRLRVERAARGTREPRVHGAHLPIATEEEGGRERIQIVRLRHLLGQLRRLARQQHSVLDAVLLDERAQPRRIGELIGLFGRERYDREALLAILLVEIREERRFIAAVRAPASGDAHEHHLALQSWIRIADALAIEILEAEPEALVRIPDA